MTPYNIKMVLIYRRDLNMRKGKIVAQCCHAATKVFFDRQTPGTTTNPGLNLIVPLTPDMFEWINSDTYAKIVLTVDNETDLIRTHELAQQAGLPSVLITDLGFTEFHGQPTKTCVAIGPANTDEIDKITGPNGVVPTKLP